MPIPVEVPKMPSVHDMLLARELNRPGEHFVYSESLKFFPQNDIDIHIDTSPKSVLRGRLGGRMSISSGRFGLTSADLNQARYCGRGEYAQYGRVVSPSNEGSATMSVPVLTSRPDSAPPQIPGWIKGVTATYEVAAVAASLRQRTLGGKLLAFGEFNAIPLIGLACASPSFTEAAPTKEPSAIVQQGVTIESPSTPQPEPSVIPEGPNSPNVQVDAQSNPLPSFEEVVIIGSESFRVVPQEEYIGWGIDAGAQAQVDAIKTKVPEGTVIQVVQSGDQWAVASVSKSGYYLPADADGKLKTSPYFRPDWVSSDVRGDYVFIADGLGTDVVRGAVLVNSHWRSVAMKDGKIVAMVDVKPDGTYEIRYSKDVTPDPLMGSPEGATGKNAKGEWIKAVTENGHEYEYVYNVELGQWVREVANFPIFDWPTFNSVRYRVFMTEKVLGERNIYQMTHKDFTMADIPHDGIFDPPPITATFAQTLTEKTGKTLPILIQEMQGSGTDLEIRIPDGTLEGKTEHVTLGTETGLTLTVMDKETLFALGGDNVSTWTTFEDKTVYSQVYGVDEAGNMLVRFAIEGSIADLSDKDLRNILFSFPANMIEYKDQSKQGLTIFAQILTTVSLQSQQDGLPHDLEIERIP